MNFDSYSNNFEVTSQYNFDVGPSSTGSNFDDKEPFSNSSLNSGESLYFDWFTSSNSSNSNISDGSSLNNFNNDQHFMPKFFVMSTTSNFQNPSSSSSSFDINYHQQQQQHQQQQRFIDSNNNNNMMEIEQLKAPETLFNLDEINQDQDDEDPTIEVAELDDDGDNSDDEFTGYYNNNNNNNNNNMGNLPASKTPCLDATAYCAELNLGAERDPFSSDIIKITNFNIFIENLKKICPKQNQTQNDEARIKALRRWFDGIPNKKKRRESFSIKMKGDKKK